MKTIIPVKTLIQAAWVAPMNRPPLREGAVVVEGGRIVTCGPARDLRRAYPDAVVEDWGNTVILPGLVNAHTHLELSDRSCGEPPEGGLAMWLRGLILRTGLDEEKIRQLVAKGIAIAIEQCQRFGVTSVGDISRQCHLTRPLLARAPLRVVSYGEVAAMAQRRDQVEQRLTAPLDTSHVTERLRIGITPHAPYTVEPAGYRRCLEIARERGLPLATHLAETAEEAEFLADHTGPLRDLWDFLGRFDDQVPRFAGGPIRLAELVGLLAYPTLLAHVNYVDDDELAILARGKASVVYCPRTHRYFGHRPHRWREMVARGINVAVGTDSCASSPNLNVVDDLRLLHEIAPEVPAARLWEMATIRGARAIGMESEVGSLSPGKWADLVAFATTSDEPLRGALETAALPVRVCIGLV